VLIKNSKWQKISIYEGEISMIKAYPKTEPMERALYKGLSVQRDIYESSAGAIITHKEMDLLASLFSAYAVDFNEEQDGVLVEVQDMVDGLLKSGEERMNNLHQVLGAFDIDSIGRISKPNSEKIDWDAIEASDQHR
jgi:hypothetical protein